MYSSRMKKGRFSLIGLSTSFTVLLAFYSVNAQAEQQTLTGKLAQHLIAQPSKCIALHQGRKCFSQVRFNWQASTAGNFCIYLGARYNQQSPLSCWKNQRQGQFSYEFESETRQEFILVDQLEQKVVAKTKVDIAWVHKASNRKRRWRLF